jgi:hypothetical protein
MTWQPIETAPKDGTRVRIGHSMDANSMKIDSICPVMGAFENGKWEPDSYFTCRDMRLRSQPTHWLPTP